MELFVFPYRPSSLCVTGNNLHDQLLPRPPEVTFHLPQRSEHALGAGLLLEGRYPESGEGNGDPRNTVLESGALAA
jgi:hypothetical protein